MLVMYKGKMIKKRTTNCHCHYPNNSGPIWPCNKIKISKLISFLNSDMRIPFSVMSVCHMSKKCSNENKSVSC